ncbi:hypothetical protein GCM10010168_69170 [Actinoplanes ianthinogenes]|uniref:SURF1-like protein n=1 Tax=Actinoplanes ianthinogenes TaxID=122358 RepID=A0ABN6CJU4_9ACTN|nr:hypothetical protein [Actinoplanes ianthinogenes]BCJ45116.1 hypothetical protein Aiant_57730 [Actinoplanes ianthinogenes]GGR40662.1 hypothetical protein GCM10010168_69170 [Actinoplanes ianthinogenes]
MVVRRALKRVATAAGALTVAAALALGTTPAAAQATPAGRSGTTAATKPATKPSAQPKPQPNGLHITGQGVPAEGIKVLQTEDPKLFRMLFSEVGWLAAAQPQASPPGKTAKLGPKYTVKVLIGEKAAQEYELYPLATGGPRAHRPAQQPGTTKRQVDGWFYGRQSMSESLRLSGVPLKAKPDVVNGGIGGGIGETLDQSELDPVSGAGHLFGQMRQLLLLNGAVLLVILTGLAGMAFLIRRRV